MALTGVKKVIFINGINEADDYMEGRPVEDAAGDTIIIAMSPSIRARLKRRGFRAADTADYFTADSHVHTLARSDELVKWLEANALFADTGLGVSSAYRDFFIYWARFAMHYCIWAIDIVSAAVEAHKPQVICAYGAGGKAAVSSLYIENSEGYFGRLVRDTAKAKGVGFTDLGSGAAGTRKEQPPRAIYTRSLVRFILQNIKFSLWEASVRAKDIFPGKTPVFFTTRFYNLDKLAKESVKEGSGRRPEILRGPVIFTYGLSDAVIRLFGGPHSAAIISQKKNFAGLVEKIRKDPAVFSYRGVSFAEAMAGKIEDNLGDHIMGLMLWTVKLNDFIDRSKAELFISNGNRADDVITAELCAKKGIRTLLISHGSHVRPKNESERIEWGEHGRALLRAPFSDIALQTPVAEGYVDAFKTQSRAIRTGPLIWGKPVERRKSGVRTIVHASTPKPTNSLRPFVYETPDEYIRGICELAAAVEGIPDAVLIVRFRPSSDIGAEDIKELVPFSGKVKLGMDGPFSAALGSADLLVSFSSTTIEEALQNRIPVLLYGGSGRYMHIEAVEAGSNGEMPRSAIYHVSKAGDLRAAIEKILGLGTDGKLFDAYIYPQNERQPLEALL